MTITLPYPPTVNTHWRNVKGRTLLSKRGREYRKAVHQAALDDLPDGEWFHDETMTGRLHVLIDLYPPDHRKRDIDNVIKPLVDALMHAGVFEDDEQIDELRVKRFAVMPPGRAVVTVQEIS